MNVALNSLEEGWGINVTTRKRVGVLRRGLSVASVK